MSAVLRGRPQTVKMLKTFRDRSHKVNLDQIAYRVRQGAGDRMQLRLLVGAVIIGALAACGGGGGATTLPAIASTSLESTQASNPSPAPKQTGTLIITIPGPGPSPTPSLCPPGWYASVNGQTGAYVCIQLIEPTPGPSTAPTPHSRT